MSGKARYRYRDHCKSSEFRTATSMRVLSVSEQWKSKSKLSLIYFLLYKSSPSLASYITIGIILFESRYRNKTDATDLNTGA
jgi:hypothetical protein